MILVGLTGNLGTGKSTVAGMLAECGAAVIDADAIVHDFFKKNGKIYSAVIKTFGRNIAGEQGVNRKVLADIVFRDPKKLNQLTSIVHPIVLKEVQRKINALRRQKRFRMVVVDAPLLIEAGWHKWVDYLIVVRSTRELQFKRLWEQRRMSKAEAQRRLKTQMPIQQKINMADIVIDNRFHLNDTRKQAHMIVQRLLARTQ